MWPHHSLGKEVERGAQLLDLCCCVRSVGVCGGDFWAHGESRDRERTGEEVEVMRLLHCF